MCIIWYGICFPRREMLMTYDTIEPKNSNTPRQAVVILIFKYFFPKITKSVAFLSILFFWSILLRYSTIFFLTKQTENIWMWTATEQEQQKMKQNRKKTLRLREKNHNAYAQSFYLFEISSGNSIISIIYTILVYIISITCLFDFGFLWIYGDLVQIIWRSKTHTESARTCGGDKKKKICENIVPRVCVCIQEHHTPYAMYICISQGPTAYAFIRFYRILQYTIYLSTLHFAFVNASDMHFCCVRSVRIVFRCKSQQCQIRFMHCLRNNILINRFYGCCIVYTIMCQPA